MPPCTIPLPPSFDSAWLSTMHHSCLAAAARHFSSCKGPAAGLLLSWIGRSRSPSWGSRTTPWSWTLRRADVRARGRATVKRHPCQCQTLRNTGRLNGPWIRSLRHPPPPTPQPAPLDPAALHSVFLAVRQEPFLEPVLPNGDRLKLSCLDFPRLSNLDGPRPPRALDHSRAF